MLLLRVGPVTTEVVTSDANEYLWVCKVLSVQVPEEYHPNAFGIRIRSAPVMCAFVRDHKFPSGLLSYLLSELTEADIPYSLEWSPEAAVLPAVNDVRQYRFPDGLVPRDNQLELVEEAVSVGRGVLYAATAAGKTAMIAMILRALGVPKSLILVGSRSLVSQTRSEISRWLGVDVGEVSSSRQIIQPDVIVGLVQSLSARSEEPWFQPMMNERRVVVADECLAPDTEVLTPYGTKILDDLEVGSEVLTPYATVARVTKRWDVVAEAYSVTYASGRRVICSSGHKSPARMGTVAGGIGPATMISTPGCSPSWFPGSPEWQPRSWAHYMLGWYLGDGCLIRKAGCKSTVLRFGFGKNSAKTDTLLRWNAELGGPPLLLHKPNCCGNVYISMRAADTAMLVSRFGLSPGRKANTCYIPGYDAMSESDKLDVIRGLFDSDGNRGQNRVTFDTTSKELLSQVMKLLCNHGLSPSVTVILRKNPKHATCYRATLYGADIRRFNLICGFRVRSKQIEHQSRKLMENDWLLDDQIVSVTPLGTRRLVDITIDSDSHMFMLGNGLASFNCHHVARSAVFRKGGVVRTKIAQGMWYELLCRCPAANRYGVSATPLKLEDPVQNWRLVGATGPVFKHRVTSTDLINAKFASRPYIYFHPFKAKTIPKAGNTYHDAVKRGIDECVERNTLIVDDAEILFQHGLKVLVLVEHLEHGEIIEKELRTRGVPAAYINGKQSIQEQEALLDWLREPSPRVMVSTRVLGEGVNVPALGALVFACGGKAQTKLVQSIGRVLRIAPDKDRCIVIIPDDNHNVYLRRHCARLRTYLAAEPGYRIAVPGQDVAEFVKAVLVDKADAVGVD